MQGITSNIQIALQNFYATFKEYFPGYDDQAVELFKIFAITFPLFLRNNWYAKEHLAVARTNLSLPLSLVMNMGRLIEERVKACSKIPVTLCKFSSPSYCGTISCSLFRHRG
jgi:hypothetical protein